MREIIKYINENLPICGCFKNKITGEFSRSKLEIEILPQNIGIRLQCIECLKTHKTVICPNGITKEDFDKCIILFNKGKKNG